VSRGLAVEQAGERLVLGRREAGIVRPIIVEGPVADDLGGEIRSQACGSMRPIRRTPRQA
jgi:hypothetical protein